MIDQPILFTTQKGQSHDTDSKHTDNIPVPWTTEDVNRLSEITKSSSHLEQLRRYLIAFGDGGIALVNPIGVCNRPSDPYYVGRCLQDAYGDAGGTEFTSDAVYRQNIKKQFHMLPAVFETIRDFLLDVSQLIGTHYPDWDILSAEASYWEEISCTQRHFFPGPFEWLIVGFLSEKFADENRLVLNTDT